MVKKRMIAALTAMALLLLLPLSVVATENEVIEIGRISITMPQITVELKGTGYDAQDVTAYLDAEQLTVTAMTPYDPVKNTTRVYVLVDLSTSMWSSFELVKKNIVSFIEKMDTEDQLVLITFGEETVDTVLSGAETREEAIAAVEQLQCNEEGTLFHEALKRAYQLSNASTQTFDREYALAFSDGIDYQKGSTTFDEALQQYGSRTLPLYAACSDGTSQSGADQFGQIARASGGALEIIKDTQTFDGFVEQINDVTLLQLQAGSNHADGTQKQLTLKIGQLQLEQNVTVSRSVADQEPPAVDSITYAPEKEAFVIAFSEPVLGANQADSYKIVSDHAGSVNVTGVYYSQEEDVYELRVAQGVANGSYTLSFSGITDASQEKNALQQSVSVTVTNGAEPATTEAADPSGDAQPAGSIGLSVGGSVYGLIGLYVLLGLVIVGAIVLVVVLATRKKPAEENTAVAPAAENQLHIYDGEQQGTVKHHIRSQTGVKLHLRIVTGKASEQNIEINLINSLILGRSEMCDIYIDDTKLSRQHFVIENDNGTLYIMDLQSRNGTMLNGIRISNRQILRNGDRILAGLSDIYITVITGR